MSNVDSSTVTPELRDPDAAVAMPSSPRRPEGRSPDSHDAPAQTGARTARLPPEAPRPVLGRVVLVEDHALICEYLQAQLETAGFDVVATAASRADGHRAVLEHRPDLAVLDNRLSDGWGVELAGVLRQDAPEVGLIIHTGAITADQTAAALRGGALEVVTKDIRTHALIDALRRHAPNRRH